MNNRLKEAMQLRDMKQSDLALKTGLAKSSICHYVKQTYQPTSQPLYLLAKALDVSEMWLAGYDVPIERKLDIDVERADNVAKISRLLLYDEKYLNIVAKIGKLDSKQLQVVESIIDQLLVVK